MEVLKNSLSNKTSITLKRNSKKQNSIHNINQGLKTNEAKNKHLMNNIQNKPKGIPLINNNKNYKLNPQIKNKPQDFNNKEILSKNLLIRALSYKKIENNDKNENSQKIHINKKVKTNLFEYKAQKIIEDINKDLINGKFKSNLSNYQYSNINNDSKIIKEKKSTNLNKEGLIFNNNKENKILNKNKDINLNININNSNLNNNNLHNIISILTSKNKIIKRNNIKNLKNISVFNKNAFNSNYNASNTTKNNYTNLMTSSNSNISTKLKNNYFKKRQKVNSINNLNISNNANSIISPNSNSITNINLNNINNTISNYSSRINHLSKQNKYITINYNNKNIDSFKNCRSQMFKKLNSNIINEIDSLNSINTSNNKYLETTKLKPSLKYIKENTIKNTILDNKKNCQFLKRNETERGNQKEVSSKDKNKKNYFNSNNILDVNNVISKNQLTDYNSNNSNNKKNSKNKNKNIFLDGVNTFNYMNKKNFNHNLNNNNNKYKNSKILLLNNSSIFSPIIKLKNKGSQKHNSNIGAYTSKFNNLNIHKKAKTNLNININNLENTDKILKSKYNVDNWNSSFSKKIGNKLNYLNINLNSLSNINNALSSNTHSIPTFQTNNNTLNDTSLNIKKKIKNKFLKKNNDSYYNKSLINSNNNIIILNNISMNNLNNISFDYLSKLTKRHYQNCYKSIASIKKQAFNYVSKEKNILDNHKELEKQREYYRNQKRLHQKKNNYKNNNRLKGENLNSFNLKQIKNILKKNKNNESINLTINTINSSKNKKDYFKTQRNNTNNNNSGNVSLNKKNKNISNEVHHRHYHSNHLNIAINTNKISNNINKFIQINKGSSNNNITYNNQKTIRNIIRNLKGKMDKNSKENEKDKISKISSAQISPKKNYVNHQIKPKSKDAKNSNKNSISLNNKKRIGNSINTKQKKSSNKKEIILRNDDNNISNKKKIETEYNNNYKYFKKKIDINCINDVNEISIEGTKNILVNSNKKQNKEKDNENNYKSLTIENKIKISDKIKINKKKYLQPKNSINSIFELNDNKEKNKKEIEDKLRNKKNEDPQEAKEYIVDIIESLLIEENYYLNEKNYINPHYLENEDSELTPEMRTVAVDWLVLIHHKIFKFKENTLFLTIQIFDRYLSKKDLNTEKTELLLLTSFMLASKHNEIDYVNMQETLQLAQNKFTKEQVIEMELDILDKIGFEILSPTMCEYFKLFASFLNLSEEKINHGLYILNIALVDFHMLKFPNFMLALAVVKLITKKNNKKLVKVLRNILEENKIFLEYLEDEEYEEILDISSKIKLLYNTFLETKYKNIQEKFSESKYNSVSSYTNI